VAEFVEEGSGFLVGRNRPIPRRFGARRDDHSIIGAEIKPCCHLVINETRGGNELLLLLLGRVFGAI
jgi:hypothetical protein